MTETKNPTRWENTEWLPALPSWYSLVVSRQDVERVLTGRAVQKNELLSWHSAGTIRWVVVPPPFCATVHNRIFMREVNIGVTKWKARLCTRLSNYHWRKLPQVFLSRQTRILSMLVVTKLCLSRQNFCHDKYLLSKGTNMFAATNICRDKCFVATSIVLSRQMFCRDKHTFIAWYFCQF